MLSEGAFDPQYPPAYLGMIDMVRTNYLGLPPNTNVNAEVEAGRPDGVVLQNFRQTTGAYRGWIGYAISDANLNVTVNETIGDQVLLPNGTQETLGHMNIFLLTPLREIIAQQATLAYTDRVSTEALHDDRPVPWVREAGQYW
jgi:hypothetical protein